MVIGSVISLCVRFAFHFGLNVVLLPLLFFFIYLLCERVGAGVFVSVCAYLLCVNACALVCVLVCILVCVCV